MSFDGQTSYPRQENSTLFMEVLEDISCSEDSGNTMQSVPPFQSTTSTQETTISYPTDVNVLHPSPYRVNDDHDLSQQELSVSTTHGIFNVRAKQELGSKSVHNLTKDEPATQQVAHHDVCNILGQSLRNKRKRDGKPELKIQDEIPAKYPLTEEEESKAEKRRRQNRESAWRHRKKKSEELAELEQKLEEKESKIQSLEREMKDFERANKDLMRENKDLKQRIKNLEVALNVYLKMGCKNTPDIILNKQDVSVTQGGGHTLTTPPYQQNQEQCDAPALIRVAVDTSCEKDEGITHGDQQAPPNGHTVYNETPLPNLTQQAKYPLVSAIEKMEPQSQPSCIALNPPQQVVQPPPQKKAKLPSAGKNPHSQEWGTVQNQAGKTDDSIIQEKVASTSARLQTNATSADQENTTGDLENIEATRFPGLDLSKDQQGFINKDLYDFDKFTDFLCQSVSTSSPLNHIFQDSTDEPQNYSVNISHTTSSASPWDPLTQCNLLTENQIQRGICNESVSTSSCVSAAQNTNSLNHASHTPTAVSANDQISTLQPKDQNSISTGQLSKRGRRRAHASKRGTHQQNNGKTPVSTTTQRIVPSVQNASNTNESSQRTGLITTECNVPSVQNDRITHENRLLTQRCSQRDRGPRTAQYPKGSDVTAQQASMQQDHRASAVLSVDGSGDQSPTANVLSPYTPSGRLEQLSINSPIDEMP